MYIELVKNIKQFCEKHLTSRASVHREVLPRLSDYVNRQSIAMFCGPIGSKEPHLQEVYQPENFEEWVASEVVKDIFVYLNLNHNTSTISGKSIIARMDKYEKYLRENTVSKQNADKIIDSLDCLVEMSDVVIDNEEKRESFKKELQKVLDFIQKYS